MDLHKIQTLLEQIGIKIKHGEEIAREKGENFNIFKILNLETKENQTHSAFLKEMLDPQGSHEMGTVFLSHFLSLIKTILPDQNQKIKILNHIKSENCKVRTEHSIGKTDLIEKTGGRLDIFIKDKGSFNIIIENKIHAGDQEAQIERYCKHEKNNSVVFYLTLEGDEPVLKSKGSLKSGDDFFLLSYREHIINWLELCLKEAADKPILRETIKQYIILLKKLTNKLTNQKMEDEIKKLMIKNLNESRKVYNLFHQVLAEIRNKFRNEIAKKIKESIGCELELLDITKVNASMFLKSKSNFVKICVSPFSWGSLFEDLNVGIWIDMPNMNKESLDDFIHKEKKHISLRPGEYWLNREDIGIQLSDLSELQKLDDNTHFNYRVNEVSSKIIEYYGKNKELVEELEVLFPSN